MTPRTLLALIGIAVLPCALAAQAPAQPTTPGGCRKAASEWFTQQYRAAQAAAREPGGKAPDPEALLTERTRRERTCAAQFHLADMSGPELLDLAALATEIGNEDEALAAVHKRLEEPGLRDRERADALNAMIGVYTRPDTAKLDEAERYLRRLDALPDSLADRKLAGHATLNAEYRYLDFDSRIRRHSMAIIALGRNMKLVGAPGGPVEMNPAVFPVVTAYTDMAEVYGDFGETDSALAILDEASSDHPELSSYVVDNLLKPERARFALIGTHAAPISADHWINAPAGTRTIDPTGHVTVLEFTAHWCLPCRNSYPGLLAMAKRFEPQGVRFIFATQFYGYVGKKRNLDQAGEMAADREYYVTEHGIHFPIAVADRPVQRQGAPYARNLNDEHYYVGGIPQVVVIDRSGVIRRIVTGWDFGNVQRLPVLLASLVGEHRGGPSPSSRR
jgi:tetratricopeptide (TPR) repeat protein